MISRKRTQRRDSVLRFLRLLAALMVVNTCLLARGEVELTNGGFENKSNPLAGWQVKADGGAVEQVLCVAWRVPREGEYGYVDFEAERKALGLE